MIESESVKARNLRTDRRMSMLVAAPEPPDRWVMFRGDAEVQTDPAQIEDQILRISQRYMGEREGAKYAAQVKEAAEASAELARRMAAAGNFSKLDQAREGAPHNLAPGSADGSAGGIKALKIAAAKAVATSCSGRLRGRDLLAHDVSPGGARGYIGAGGMRLIGHEW